MDNRKFVNTIYGAKLAQFHPVAVGLECHPSVSVVMNSIATSRV